MFTQLTIAAFWQHLYTRYTFSTGDVLTKVDFYYHMRKAAPYARWRR